MRGRRHVHKKRFENCRKCAIEYSGGKTHAGAEIGAGWRDRHRAGRLPADREVLIAANLMRGSKAEDKFAGITYIQKYLLGKADAVTLLDTAETLFGEGAFFDWSTNDWFCVRVLGPIYPQSSLLCLTPHAVTPFLIRLLCGYG